MSDAGANGSRSTTMIMTALGVAGITGVVATAAGTISGRNAADAAIERARQVISADLEDIRIEHRSERADIRQTERQAREALEVNLRRDLDDTRTELRELHSEVGVKAKESELANLEHRISRIEAAFGNLEDIIKGRHPPLAPR